MEVFLSCITSLMVISIFIMVFMLVHTVWSESICEDCCYCVDVVGGKMCGCAKFRTPTAESKQGYPVSCYTHNHHNLCPEFIPRGKNEVGK